MRLSNALLILYAVDRTRSPPSHRGDDPLTSAAGVVGRLLMWVAFAFYGLVSVAMLYILATEPPQKNSNAVVAAILFALPLALGIVNRKGLGSVCLLVVPVVMIVLGSISPVHPPIGR